MGLGRSLLRYGTWNQNRQRGCGLGMVTGFLREPFLKQ